MKYALLIMSIFFAGSVFSSDITVEVGDVKDSRSTGKFFNELSVELKLSGDGLEHVEKVRLILAKAMDDTGRNLLKEEKFYDHKAFEDFRGDGTGQAQFELKLENPARNASVIREISGEIELYSPRQDPLSRVTISRALIGGGKIVTEKVLQEAQVELSIYSKEAYENFLKDSEKGGAVNPNRSMNQMFSGMLGSDENSVYIRFKDPQSKVIGFKFFAASGEEIRPDSWGYSGDLKTFSFGSAFSQDISVEVMLKTEKAIKTVPIHLVDISLP